MYKFYIKEYGIEEDPAEEANNFTHTDSKDQDQSVIYTILALDKMLFTIQKYW